MLYYRRPEREADLSLPSSANVKNYKRLVQLNFGLKSRAVCDLVEHG